MTYVERFLCNNIEVFFETYTGINGPPHSTDYIDYIGVPMMCKTFLGEDAKIYIYHYFSNNYDVVLQNVTHNDGRNSDTNILVYPHDTHHPIHVNTSERDHSKVNYNLQDPVPTPDVDLIFKRSLKGGTMLNFRMS